MLYKKGTKKSLLRKIFDLIPRNRVIYRICKRYVDNCKGLNNSDIHTNGELRFMRHNLKNCKVVFDVGANIGKWTKLALNINRDLIIHCFEPSTYTFKKLQNTVPANVICNDFGLSSTKQEGTLFIFGNGSGLNSLYQRRGLEDIGINPPKKVEKIKLDTMDNYCREKWIPEVDFVKIDVEGHEFEVFKGMENMLANNQIKMIQFEYGGANIDSRVFLMDIFDFFKNMDYNFYKIFSDRLEFVERYKQDFDNFQYQNWLIIWRNYKYVP